VEGNLTFELQTLLTTIFLMLFLEIRLLLLFGLDSFEDKRISI
jgi:hypothetical protein